MMSRWAINNTPNVADYYEQFGDSLLTIANELRTLESGLGENLRRVSHNISIHIYKVLIGGDHQPLLNCIKDPKLPRLLKPHQLNGDPYELFPPYDLELSPPPSGPGTGLALHWEGKVLPLHGLSYDAKSNGFFTPTPWDYQRAPIRLRYWTRQNLIQINHTCRQIGEIIKLVRNQRGAHSDRKWMNAAPRPLINFFSLYVSLFVVQIGSLLVDKVSEIAQDNEVRGKIFPDSQHPDRDLKYAAPRTNTIRVKTPGLDFSFSEAISLAHSPPSERNRMRESFLLWCLKAPEQKR